MKGQISRQLVVELDFGIHKKWFSSGLTLSWSTSQGKRERWIRKSGTRQRLFKLRAFCCAWSEVDRPSQRLRLYGIVYTLELMWKNWIRTAYDTSWQYIIRKVWWSIRDRRKRGRLGYQHRLWSENSQNGFIALGLHEFLGTILIIIITGMEFKDTSLSRQNPKFLRSNVFIIP